MREGNVNNDEWRAQCARDLEAQKAAMVSAFKRAFRPDGGPPEQTAAT